MPRRSTRSRARRPRKGVTPPHLRKYLFTKGQKGQRRRSRR